jgi:hypothetical protein
MAEGGLTHRMIWFVGLWAAGVAVVVLVGAMIKLVLGA